MNPQCCKPSAWVCLALLHCEGQIVNGIKKLLLVIDNVYDFSRSIF